MLRRFFPFAKPEPTAVRSGTVWHSQPAEAVLDEHETSNAGLSEAEAARRLEKFGLNELAVSGMKGPWRILWEQLTALLMVVLYFAIVISLILRDYVDALAIGAIVMMNALLGFHQEYRAEGTIAALKKLAVPNVRVRRDGTVREIQASHLVPGDIVLVEAGNFIPADCRVLAAHSLQAREAALTGESDQVVKSAETVTENDLPLSDRRNMVYMGTFVTTGRGELVVVATGMATELGHIATLIRQVGHQDTPLQHRLNQLAKKLAGAALFVVLLIIVIGVMRGDPLKQLFLTAVSMGVAAVPEGLAAVVTIALSLGANRMLRRNALIRKPSAVETLGSVSVICSDKTGTLTRNEMTVTELHLADGRTLALDGDVDQADGGFRLLVSLGALCNDVQPAPQPDQPPVGDATEVALVVAANRFGLQKNDLEKSAPRVGEVPFTSERMRMTTFHEVRGDLGWGGDAPFITVTKGAVESLLEVCSAVWINGQIEPLSRERHRSLAKVNANFAEQGSRVLGMAVRGGDQPPEGAGVEVEADLVFVGMAAMMDPPRTEALPAINECRAAGIRPVMITGDHPATALSIATRLGIAGNGSVVTGAQLSQLSGAELETAVTATQVYARVSPEHKLRIVECLQNQGQIVAMTGDGVNDAPALKMADIGVAMGKTGTDVAREAADMVLLDDNFATIVAAVEEGRVIYENLRKFIRYILTTNAGEIWVMLIAPAFGMPLPLLPLQILWMNLVTDGLPALALGLEPAEPDLMRRKPSPKEESIFARGVGVHVLWVGLLMGLLSLGAGYWLWQREDAAWQTLLFTTLTFCQMTHIMAIRSGRQSCFTIGFTSNLPLLGAVALTVLLQLALIYLPFLQSVFGTVALKLSDLGLAFAVSTVLFVAVELEKRFLRTHPVD
jgi:Ca2+-transporting ATPase